MGYIGRCIPFAACLVLVLGAGRIGISMETAMAVTFAVTAVWWIAGMVFFIYSLRVEPEKKEQREELIKSKLAVTEEY